MKLISPDSLYHRSSGNLPDEVFSMRPLYEFLLKKKADDKVITSAIYSSLIHEIERRPELKSHIEPAIFQHDRLILEMIYTITSNIVHATEDDLWGLALPVSIDSFYGTDRIARLVVNKQNNICNLQEQEESSYDNRRMAFMYATVLEKVYHYQSKLCKSLVLEIPNTESKVFEYYEVNIDTTFLDVFSIGDLPPLDLSRLRDFTSDDEILAFLIAEIPLSTIRFEGFTILTLKDVTEQHALSTIRNSILTMDEESREVCERDIKSALHTLANTSFLEFGLIPLVMLNGKPVFDFGELTKTVVSTSLSKNDTLLEEEVHRFMLNPEPLFIPDVSVARHQDASLFLRAVLQNSNLESYALVPLFSNKQLVGAIEITSREKDVLTTALMQKLDAAFPLLSQLLKYAVETIQNRISSVVSEKFTAIQSAVAWKFREAAWTYLRRSRSEQARIEIEPVLFKHLYPLYGAIDVRNSSIERNKALKLDLNYQLGFLSDTLTLLKKNIRLSILDEVNYRIEKWLFTPDSNSAEEHKVSQYLETEVVPFLKHVRTQYPDSEEAINAYLEATDPITGLAYQHRRELEKSMQMITQAISLYLDLMNVEMQKAYPCYFDKFRTDGIEYDIYIGQSLRPDMPFDLMYLRNLRFMQLSSMAGIYKQLHSMLPQMPHQLQTTQLIYVNSDPIDISFRMDEKRFDVEGGYNIRYQMIKKRIDKVHVRGTGERLTQPGTIAIVYSRNADVHEYVSYVEYLRDSQILEGEIEYLDMEELQGVDGLKALRVRIKVEDQKNPDE